MNNFTNNDSVCRVCEKQLTDESLVIGTLYYSSGDTRDTYDYCEDCARAYKAKHNDLSFYKPFI